MASSNDLGWQCLMLKDTSPGDRLVCSGNHSGLPCPFLQVRIGLVREALQVFGKVCPSFSFALPPGVELNGIQLTPAVEVKTLLQCLLRVAVLSPALLRELLERLLGPTSQMDLHPFELSGIAIPRIRSCDIFEVGDPFIPVSFSGKRHW